jgi:U4/U6.U5 tri-snRNP-associated protein 1
MDVSEVKMKKPKKKKAKKAKRERIEDEEEMLTVPADEPAAENMELDEEEGVAPKPKKKTVFDESFIDDDDLQANLAAQRQKALKKRKQMRPEDIAQHTRRHGVYRGCWRCCLGH